MSVSRQLGPYSFLGRWTVLDVIPMRLVFGNISQKYERQPLYVIRVLAS